MTCVLQLVLSGAGKKEVRWSRRAGRLRFLEGDLAGVVATGVGSRRSVLPVPPQGCGVLVVGHGWSTSCGRSWGPLTGQRRFSLAKIGVVGGPVAGPSSARSPDQQELAGGPAIIDFFGGKRQTGRA